MQVARIFRRRHSTIDDLWRKFQATGSVADLPRASRQRVTTAAQDRYMRLTHLRNRSRPATETAKATIGVHRRPISGQTVRNRLRANDLRARRPYTGQILTRRHRRLRLAWARAHVRWTRAQWATVLFTDESRFNVHRRDGRARVYRRRGERFRDACVKESDRFGGGSTMIWAGIALNHKTDVIVVNGNLNAQRYRDDILATVVTPLFRVNPHLTLMHDNATSHTAAATRNFLTINNVNVIDWPAVSPDLNPIEHLWDELDRRVRGQPNPPESVAQMRQALLAQWQRIGQPEIRRLIRSMRRRCQAVIDANGGHNRY